jgi:rsbT co-antagonist protein RsbR
MDLTQRQVVLGLLVLQVVCSLLLLLGQVMLDGGSTTMASAFGVLFSAALLIAYWQGLEYARHINVVIVTLLIGLGTQMLYVTGQTALIVLVPPALALVMAGPPWILGSAGGTLAIYLVRGNGNTVYTNDIRTSAIMIVVVSSMFLGRVVADSARRAAERSTRQAEAAQAGAEQQARALEAQAEVLTDQNQRQQRLLELVATLETPTVALANGVLLAPLVGHLDGQRADALTKRLLHTVHEQRARLVLLDIAGVAEVDGEVASALLTTARALRLLGCEVAITGISSTVATVLAQRSEALAGITTARTPQEVLEQYLHGRF